MRVFLAESEAVLARLYEDGLKRAGHVVTVVRDPVNAMAVATGSHFDVMICNLELNGEAVVRRLNDLGIRTPIVLMADDHRHLHQVGDPLLSAGMVQVLEVKPLSVATLVATVTRILSHR